MRTTLITSFILFFTLSFTSFSSLAQETTGGNRLIQLGIGYGADYNSGPAVALSYRVLPTAHIGGSKFGWGATLKGTIASAENGMGDDASIFHVQGELHYQPSWEGKGTASFYVSGGVSEFPYDSGNSWDYDSNPSFGLGFQHTSPGRRFYQRRFFDLAYYYSPSAGPGSDGAGSLILTVGVSF